MQQKIIDTINNIDTDPDNLELFKECAEIYCSQWELCNAYKNALIAEINDQFDNHFHDSDQNADALEIYKILTK